MKWRGPPERAIEALALVLVTLTLPVWLVFVAVIWLGVTLERACAGPPEWTRWFAWRPVQFEDEPRLWAWLETVERRHFGWTSYRPLSAHPAETKEG